MQITRNGVPNARARLSRSCAPATASTSSPARNHWHGAAPDRFMTHLAIQEFGDDGPVVWGEPVTDARYLG